MEWNNSTALLSHVHSMLIVLPQITQSCSNTKFTGQPHWESFGFGVVCPRSFSLTMLPDPQKLFHTCSLMNTIFVPFNEDLTQRCADVKINHLFHHLFQPAGCLTFGSWSLLNPLHFNPPPSYLSAVFLFLTLSPCASRRVPPRRTAPGVLHAPRQHVLSEVCPVPPSICPHGESQCTAGNHRLFFHTADYSVLSSQYTSLHYVVLQLNLCCEHHWC